MGNWKYTKRCEIYLAKLEGEGSVQNGIKPVIVVSGDEANESSSNITAIPITSKDKKPLPTHVIIESNNISGLDKESLALAEGITTISKDSIIKYIGVVCKEEMKKVDRAIRIHLQMENVRPSNPPFKEIKARSKAEAILKLEKVIREKVVANNYLVLSTILNSIKFQYEDLKSYCEYHDKNVDKYYKPRIDFDNGNDI